ncbi:ParB/RepB/Spo0J family partition protein [Deinococcus aerophilus]|uniref:Plasmid-partitioning protein ParB n=1 Tax=Deinococcus aerophilus TaxID=522488 RepID=A0ABQ2GX51_9DEIO|nr:ParB/RepB/Spo0J family partition protein [Deinococcus aerophilus]GGM16466.1 putative plasmid-partitioning protein ParB [Deinococcus aerophilus]
MPRAKPSRADAFGSLLGTAKPELASPGPSAVALDQIRVRARQPRRHFDEGSLASLAQSIREQGVLQPVLLRQTDRDYELIAGERRVRAARLAGLSEVPAVVRDASDEEADVLAALENLQREDLNPLDEVEATLTIVARELCVPVDEVVPLLHAQRRTPDPQTVTRLDGVFARLGRGTWRSFATNKAGVLRFPPELLELMRQGSLEYTRAAALSRVKDDALRAELICRTLEENLSVREIASAAKPPPTEATQLRRVRDLLDERQVARLGVRERKRIHTLLDELETILNGAQGQRS